MKKSILAWGLTVLLIGGAVVTSSAQSASKWEVDRAHSSVIFDVNHLFSAVTGRFKDFDGEINFDPADLNGSSANFTIKVNSINTDDDDRDSHLQSEDFFAAADYPEIKFISTGFTKTGENLYDITGKLTMRGTTQTIVLPMEVKGVMDSPWVDDQIIMGASILTTLDRTDYKVGTGSWAATAIVGDEVRIKIDLEMQSNKG